MRRYLQNNTDVCLILNFLCILPIFKILSLQHIQTVKIIESILEFLEAIYQNVTLSGEKWHLPYIIVCLLTGEIHWYFYSVIKKHPVAPASAEFGTANIQLVYRFSQKLWSHQPGTPLGLATRVAISTSLVRASLWLLVLASRPHCK